MRLATDIFSQETALSLERRSAVDFRHYRSCLLVTSLSRKALQPASRKADVTRYLLYSPTHHYSCCNAIVPSVDVAQHIFVLLVTNIRILPQRRHSKKRVFHAPSLSWPLLWNFQSCIISCSAKSSTANYMKCLIRNKKNAFELPTHECLRSVFDLALADCSARIRYISFGSADAGELC